MAYIKTHSNYVLKSKHQTTDNGVIYERDWVTIGGLNQFSPTQIPIYKSSNFIITTNNDGTYSKNILNSNWEETENGSEVWTLSDVENLLSNNTDSDRKIVIKQDYYSLRDFAYYGSCSELVRASINDIIARFPGELCVPQFDGSGTTVQYTTNVINNGSDDNKDYANLGEGKWLLDNPFNIDLHTILMDDGKIDNKLKYFCNEGFKNYQIVRGDNKSDITSWNVVENEGVENCKGVELGKIYVNGLEISYYNGDDGKIYYFVNPNSNFSIRPKHEFYIDFINSLDNFQKVLLNTNTDPLYKATFEVISENDFGYITSVKDFIFPLGYGGYNIGTSDFAFERYLQDLSRIASYYDEVFCDNLYRSMTHEAIKNFDWTYTRKYTDGEEEEYVIGGNRIASVIRLFGRQFDEIKTYIDNMLSSNKVTYDDTSNLPDYFLSDSLENDGWNILPIYALKYEEKDGKKTFSPIMNNIVYPYNKCDDGYFLVCDCQNGGLKELKGLGGDVYIDETCDGRRILRHRIKRYCDNVGYTSTDVNNQFLKRLKLNSRAIWKSKGTLNGIEMVLGLFGLKSKRWCDKYKSDACYDYEIKEYTVQIEKPIFDDKTDRPMHTIDWYNWTKMINYGTTDYINGIYTPYQGLPISYKLKNENDLDSTRYLYPYFSKDGIYDGNMYYQMNGGWLRKYKDGKPWMFDKDNNIITGDNVYTFTETLRTVKSVNTIRELLSLPMQSLRNGDTYYVNNLNGDYTLIDGVVYDLKSEEISGNTYYYFETYIGNNSIKVGNTYFTDKVEIYNPNYFNSNDTNTISFDNKNNGMLVKIFVNENEMVTPIITDGKKSLPNPIVYSNGNFTDDEDSEKLTHYFKLNDVLHKNELLGDGWNQLTSYDELGDYKRLNAIVDDFKGNNPHCGNMSYDNGQEYFLYFKQLFKYAYENELFDKRCYDNYVGALEDIKGIGFDFPIDECGTEYGESADTKVHYFGEVIDRYGNKTKLEIKDVTRWENEPYKIEMNNITNAIMNTKRIDITFNVPSRDLAVIKYYDYIILNYLTQVLPSTAICKINYSTN